MNRTARVRFPLCTLQCMKRKRRKNHNLWHSHLRPTHIRDEGFPTRISQIEIKYDGIERVIAAQRVHRCLTGGHMRGGVAEYFQSLGRQWAQYRIVFNQQ